LACVMVFKSFFEFKLDFFVVRDEDPFVGQYQAFALLLLQTVQVNRSASLALLFEIALFAGVDPFSEVLLRLGVGLDENVVFVEFQVIHRFDTGED